MTISVDGPRATVTLLDLPKAQTVGVTCIKITETVLEMLDEREMRPEELAKSSGIGSQRLQNRLNLQAPWSLDEVERLSEVFGVPWSHWFPE